MRGSTSTLLEGFAFAFPPAFDTVGAGDDWDELFALGLPLATPFAVAGVGELDWFTMASPCA